MKFIAIFLFYIFPIWAFSQQLTPEDGKKFRTFFHDIIRNTDIIKQAGTNRYKTAQLEDLLHKFPDIDEMISSGKHLDEILPTNKTKNILKTLAPEFDSFHDYYLHLRELRNTRYRKIILKNVDLFQLYSQGISLKQILKVSHLDNMVSLTGDGDIQDFLNKFWNRTCKNLAITMVDSDIKNLSSQSQKALLKSISYISQLSDDKQWKLINNIPDESLEKINREITEKIKHLDFSNSNAIDALRNSSFDIPNKKMKKLAEIMATKYFDKNMPVITKRNILLGILALRPAEHYSKAQLAVLHNTDILFQKAVQLFAGKSNNTQLKILGKKLKSGLTFLSDEELEYIIRNTFGDELRGQLKNIKQVAAATTATGSITTYNGNKVFIKILRPGLMPAIHRDQKRILSMLEGQKGIQSLVKSITEGIIQEIQLKREAFNYIVARMIYNDSKLGIYVPKIIQDFPINNQVMMMEVAPGKNVSNLSLKDLSDKQLRSLQKAYYNGLKKWSIHGLQLKHESVTQEDVLKKIKTQASKIFGKDFFSDKELK